MGKVSFHNDHGLLTGLADNDHPQYVNAVADTASLDLTLAGQSISGTVLAAGVDHGTLAGLTDDDHVAYARLTGRAGGQILKGGTGVGESLSFWTNTTGTVGTYYLTDLFTNGFVKTSGGTGALSIDTTAYLPAVLGMAYTWFMA